MSRPRVVVTGVGAVTPPGLTTEEAWQGLLAGRSGIGPITEFDPSRLPVRIAGEVRFDPARYHALQRSTTRLPTTSPSGPAAHLTRSGTDWCRQKGPVSWSWSAWNMRGAPILAELLGCSSSSDGFHVAQPDLEGQGALRTMRGALQDAGVRPEEVDYINAHGTATSLNDVVETQAIK